MGDFHNSSTWFVCQSSSSFEILSDQSDPMTRVNENFELSNVIRVAALGKIWTSRFRRKSESEFGAIHHRRIAFILVLASAEATIPK